MAMQTQRLKARLTMESESFQNLLHSTLSGRFGGGDDDDDDSSEGEVFCCYGSDDDEAAHQTRMQQFAKAEATRDLVGAPLVLGLKRGQLERWKEAAPEKDV